MPEATIQATFNLSPELYDRLKDQARTETRSMRQIVEEDPSKPRFIKTVWGVGYMLIADVES